MTIRFKFAVVFHYLFLFILFSYLLFVYFSLSSIISDGFRVRLYVLARLLTQRPRSANF